MCGTGSRRNDVRSVSVNAALFIYYETQWTFARWTPPALTSHHIAVISRLENCSFRRWMPGSILLSPIIARLEMDPWGFQWNGWSLNVFFCGFFFKQSGSKRGDERENDESFGEDTSDNQIGFGFKRSQTIVLTVNNRNRINPYYRATVTIIKACTNYMNTRKSHTDPKGG